MSGARRPVRWRWGPAQLAAVAASLVTATSLAAQGPVRDHLYDRLELSIGPALLLMDTRIRVDAPAFGLGTEIHAEKDLGLAEDNVFLRATVRWRPWRRQDLELGYQRIRRSARTSLGRDITFGDTTFTVGAAVRGWLDSDVLGLRWRWAVHATDNWRIGPTVGLGALFFDTGIRAEAGVVGGPEVAAEASVSELGPTAAVGMFSQHRLGQDWVLEVDALALRLTIGEYSGRILEAGLAVRYFPADWLGIELGAEANGIRVNVDLAPDEREPALAYVRYSYVALRLSAVVAF